jgi:hypothetical protein
VCGTLTPIENLGDMRLLLLGPTALRAHRASGHKVRQLQCMDCQAAHNMHMTSRRDMRLYGAAAAPGGGVSGWGRALFDWRLRHVLHPLRT